MNITMPELALVLLVGASGSGKSTFARKYFLPSESVSSDFCRQLICDDENNQGVSSEAFDLLHTIVSKRLSLGRLTVVDATNVQPEARKPLLEIARKYHCIPCAIVFNYPERICRERNHHRTDRNFGSHVITRQTRQMKQVLKSLKREGFRHIFIINDPSEAEDVTITRQPLWNNKKSEHGPFDIIGDIHGCFGELTQLLDKLGYEIKIGEQGSSVFHPAGRKLVFLGDYCDRGPEILKTLKFIMDIADGGNVFCLPGNHEKKLIKALTGKNVTLNHGLQNSMEQLAGESEETRERIVKFLTVWSAIMFLMMAGLLPPMQALRKKCRAGDRAGSGILHSLVKPRVKPMNTVCQSVITGLPITGEAPLSFMDIHRCRNLSGLIKPFALIPDVYLAEA